MGTVLQAGPGAEPRAPGRARRRAAGQRRRRDDQQGLRLGPQDRDARRAGDQGRGWAVLRRRRHGVHVPGSLLPAAGPRRPAPRPWQAPRRHDRRRPLGRVRGLPHGQHGRARGPGVQDQPRGPGRLLRSSRIAARWRPGRTASSRPRSSPSRCPGRKGAVTVVDRDEGPRADASVEGLGQAAPRVPAGRRHGDPGNASTINDGAAALVVVDEDFAKAEGLKPLARITGYATGGMAPKWVMMAPEAAFQKLCTLTKLGLNDFDLIELNEAFAVQAVALTRKLELDPAKVNVHGGAVALGHPIGCSGRSRPDDAAARAEGPRSREGRCGAVPGRRQRRRAVGRDDLRRSER